MTAVILLVVVAINGWSGDHRQRDPRLALLDQHSDIVLSMYRGGESISLNPSPILCDGLDKSWLPTSPGTYGDIIFEHVPGETDGTSGTWKSYIILAGAKSVGLDQISIEISYDPIIDNCVGELIHSGP